MKNHFLMINPITISNHLRNLKMTLRIQKKNSICKCYKHIIIFSYLSRLNKEINKYTTEGDKGGNSNNI